MTLTLRWGDKNDRYRIFIVNGNLTGIVIFHTTGKSNNVAFAAQ